MLYLFNVVDSCEHTHATIVNQAQFFGKLVMASRQASSKAAAAASQR